MTPRSSIQNKEVREATINKITKVAMELFANDGFHTTSVSKIAIKAGIAKGLMYNYFESKEDLLRHILFTRFDEIMESLDFNHDGTITNEELILFIRNMFAMVKANFSFWKLYFAIATQPLAMKIIKDEYEKRYGSTFMALYNYFIANNYEDPEAEMRLFISMLDGVAFGYVMDKGVYPIDAIEKKIIKMYETKV
jgi:AcrR family transcriptional regulator